MGHGSGLKYSSWAKGRCGTNKKRIKLHLKIS